eukprot:CAMPEP_0195284840 /NCGR_PEP_ID=MMETSP0707-20130614/2897_1 /TAXON_ID=33640 /ORGANISM="Asterionellopsis glacialis, Strain CCMP134" /LENGTH=355 /DNA_ID=CAMNT_0040344241 /DNA_START=377 /DNA_END=1444 /DNA_ORIENTATION=-
MALIPLPVDELEELLVTGLPTASQYSTYWGRTSREQYSNFFESATVTILGVFCSYFLSFVVGSFPATLLGFVFAFWTILSPELKAFSRNWELRSGRELVDIWSIDPTTPQDKQGLYGSLFIGHVQDVSVVEDSTTTEEYDLVDFQDYTMEYDEHEQWTGTPYLLRIQIAESTTTTGDDEAGGGEEGRQLQLHARMSEEYLDIEAGQPIVGVLLSTSQTFSKLAAMTDLYIPDAECWVGDYPYLDRFVMEELLAQNDDVWELVEMEREENSTGSTPYDDDDDDDDDDGTPPRQVRKKKKEYTQEGEFDEEDDYYSYYDDTYYDENDKDDEGDDDSILKSSSRKEKVPIRKRGRRRP